MFRRVPVLLLSLLALSGAAQAACPTPAPAGADTISATVATVNGLTVDQYAWYDSQCRRRTVSLKRQGSGNPGQGGYAVQMTYETAAGTVTANASPTYDGGFGYFVSHERYRRFADGASTTIAAKIFKTNDSPLGLAFPVASTPLPYTAGAAARAHRYTLTYPRYGTIDPIAKNSNGDDVRPSPLDPAAYRRYLLPVTLTWVFQKGMDAPRIDVVVDLSVVPGPDRVNFDLRAPYGVMLFDNNINGMITRVMWADRYHFATVTNPPTRSSAWTWNSANAGARYLALVAGRYEMGLFEPRLFASTALADGWAGARGSTSSVYNGGRGCPYQAQLLPCDWEWPYQSIQYSLPYPGSSANASTQPAYFKKMAWGSSAFYGTGPSLPRVWDTSTTSMPFNGWPADMKLRYGVCVLLGETTSTGLTRTAAQAPGSRCATAAF